MFELTIGVPREAKTWPGFKPLMAALLRYQTGLDLATGQKVTCVLQYCFNARARIGPWPSRDGAADDESR